MADLGNEMPPDPFGVDPAFDATSRELTAILTRALGGDTEGAEREIVMLKANLTSCQDAVDYLFGMVVGLVLQVAVLRGVTPEEFMQEVGLRTAMIHEGLDPDGSATP